MLILTLNSFVFADTNGVWHKASDVQSGTFGSDEGNGNFHFQNKLSIATTDTTNSLNIDGDMSTSKIFDYEDSNYFLDSNLISKLNNLEINDVTLNGQTITNWHEGESDTFTDVTTRDSVTSNSITISSLIDFQNIGYYLNPDSTSVLNILLSNLVSTRKLADLDDISYVLDLNSNSNFNNIDSVSIDSQSILLNGVSIDAGFVNTGEANSVTSSMISANTIQSVDVDSSQIQLRVSSTCAAGSSIRAIASDGTVTCETDTDTNTQLSEATVDSFANNNGYQNRVSSTCAAGSSIRAIAADGSVTCETDTDTTIADTNTHAGTICASGEYLDGDGSCYSIPVDTTIADTNTNAATTCTAGQYLDGDGSCYAIPVDTTIADTNTQLSEATVDSYANNNGYQLRVSGSCSAGSSIRAISASGTVTCETDSVGAAISCPCGTCGATRYGGFCESRQQICTLGGWSTIGDLPYCVCFAVGTNVVMFDGTNKDIETIIPGDYVVNELGEKDLVLELVEHLVGTRNTYMINGKIETTADHPFKTTSGWKAISAEEFETTQNFGYYENINADILHVGDVLVTKTGTELILTIEELSTRDESDIVYTLMLENGKAFYAEDYLVAAVENNNK